MRLALPLALLTVAAAPIAVLAQTRPAPRATAPATAVDRSIYDAPIRAEDKARDVWRHPAATLAFFGVKPGMTVVEYMPGSGWYTRILGPMLAKGGGRYIAVNPAPATLPISETGRASIRDGAAKFPAQAAEWTRLPAATFASHTTDQLPAALDGTVDRVLIFREMHNLQRWNVADSELKAMRRLLKPGGMLGIVQHRAKATAQASYADGNHGYLRQTDLVNFVTAMGFDLVGTSEVNANSKDAADYEKGVWTLAPSFSAGDVDRAKVQAIGESDRMTLLFKKRA